MHPAHPLRLALLLAAPAVAQTAGSPVIDRPENDSSSGMVNVQTWSRDLSDPQGSSLSNALQIVVCP